MLSSNRYPRVRSFFQQGINKKGSLEANLLYIKQRGLEDSNITCGDTTAVIIIFEADFL